MSDTLTPIQVITENAVAIRAEGEVRIVGLSDEFKAGITKALAWMDNELETDEDFVRAKSDVKDSAEMEKRLKTSLDEMLSGQKEVAETKMLMEGYISSFAGKRKTLNNSVKTRDIEKKKAITDAGKEEIAKVLSLTSVSRIFRCDLSLVDSAIKNKKKYSVMEEEVAKVVASEVERLAWFEKTYDKNTKLLAESVGRVPSLKYHDRNALLTEDTDKLVYIIEARENEQTLLLKEEADRAAKAEAERKAEADRIAKEKAEQDEKDRIAKIEADKLAEQEKQAEVKPEPPPEKVADKQEAQPQPELRKTTFKEPPAFSEPPPLAADKTYTISFQLTGSETRRDEICGRLRVAPGVSNVTVEQ